MANEKIRKLTLVPLNDTIADGYKYIVDSTKNLIKPLVGSHLTQLQVQEWIEDKHVDVVINRRKDSRDN